MRILHIVDSLDMGGIQTFLLNLNRAIDTEKIQFDYMVFRPHEQVLESEFKALGAKIFKLPNWRNGIRKNRIALRIFFGQHSEYSIIHYHAGTLVDVGPLVEAKKAGIKVRIMHSHNTHAGGMYLNTVIHKVNKKRISDLATHYFACGKMAAQWMFSGTAAINKVKVINNGINVQKYSYNDAIRERKRNELNLSNSLVLGHIGRFSEEKNQGYLIKVMDILIKRNPNAKLLFVGDGVERRNVEDLAKKCDIETNVLFLGIRNDVEELLQAMDVFVLPSLFEGFPLVLVEAQAAGLPCIVADTVSKEVAMNENVHIISLDGNENEWVEMILSSEERVKEQNKIIDAGFDITDTAIKLLRFYELVNKR